jgi:hypothetical protein
MSTVFDLGEPQHLIQSIVSLARRLRELRLGCQCTSYTFGKSKEAGVMPSMGSVGDEH